MATQNGKRGDKLGVERKTDKDEKNTLIHAAANGTLSGKLKKYLKGCRPPANTDLKKDPGRLPNLAGFCATMGCGTQDAAELKRHYPRIFDFLCAVLEDEVLNFSHSPALLNSYLKERLGYGEKSDSDDTDIPLQPIFEHDILADGE